MLICTCTPMYNGSHMYAMWCIRNNYGDAKKLAANIAAKHVAAPTDSDSADSTSGEDVPDI